MMTTYNEIIPGEIMPGEMKHSVMTINDGRPHSQRVSFFHSLRPNALQLGLLGLLLICAACVVGPGYVDSGPGYGYGYGGGYAPAWDFGERVDIVNGYGRGGYPGRGGNWHGYAGGHPGGGFHGAPAHAAGGSHAGGGHR